MSKNNNRSLASQALLEMDQITSAIKEESKKSLNVLLAEAVKNALREKCNEADEDEYEVVDDEEKNANDNAEDSQVDFENEEDAVDGNETETESPYAEESETEAETEANVDTQEAPENGEGDEWDEFSDYQVGDNAYDLTGENDYEKVVKVYKLLTADDQVVVTKDGNKIQLKDDSVGTEYVIDLGDEGEETEVEKGEELTDLNEEILGPNDPEFNGGLRGYFDVAGFEDVKNADDEFEPESEDGIEMNPRNHKYASDREIEYLMNSDEDFMDYKEEPMFESKKVNKIKENKTRRPMKESKEVLFEVDLGYTDNYQDKDPIAGLSNNEPSKSGKSWHKGVPTGTEKPWAGNAKSKSEPFAKTISEEEMADEVPVEEGAMTVSSQSVAKETATPTSEPRRNNARQVAKNIRTAGKGYEATLAENKKLKAENKELKEAILAIRKNLSEAYVTNANLGKITKLFLENTTSQAEKIDIVNRFSNEAKTIEESKALYESIKRELNKPVATSMPLSESMTSANGNMINENKIYQSNDLMKTIEFMKKVMNY